MEARAYSVTWRSPGVDHATTLCRHLWLRPERAEPPFWREFRQVGVAVRAAPEWMIWVRPVPPGGLLRRRYAGRVASSG
jgi:hypothetical protein